MTWEYRLGITTRGSVQVSVPDGFEYSTISYSAILAILDNIFIKPEDVFVDLGCGKGRALCCAARRNIQEVIGVDANSDLCEIAKCNAASVRGKKAPIKIINELAQNFDYSKGTIFYLFNPFGVSTLDKVLSKMLLSLEAHQRFIRIAYVNPEHESLLMECDWLHMYDRWKPRADLNLRHFVSFWRTKNLTNWEMTRR